MSWLGLMPLRGGSKSIPRKNLYPLAGKPLFAWSLEQALESAVFDQLVVATEDADIARAVEARFAGAVTVVPRSPATATDTATSESVMLEVCADTRAEVVALIQATSPLTRACDFREARELFVGRRLDSLLTAVRSRRFIWSDDARPLNYDFTRRPRRQDFAGSLVENGAFYYTRTALLRRTRCRLGGRIGIHEMHQDTAREVDEPEDLAAIERELHARSGPGRAKTRFADTGGTSPFAA